ncbi:unnamed protein product [Lactuca virosa]|uniref:Kinesin motor domain-containing protein n=1 Tax=Lactuca virosa TaxID=75947 RepID=A0AAU9LUV5_9ASTR|nr:unnamed protein product [Lactuca virosa]
MERKGGNTVPSSPSHTPRSTDKAVRDLRHVEGNMSGKHDKEKGVNVQVVVRCRPMNADEEKLHTPMLLHVQKTRGKYVQFRI